MIMMIYEKLQTKHIITNIMLRKNKKLKNDGCENTYIVKHAHVIDHTKIEGVLIRSMFKNMCRYFEPAIDK